MTILLEWVEFQKIVSRLAPVVAKVINLLSIRFFKCNALASFRWNSLNFIDDSLCFVC